MKTNDPDRCTSGHDFTRNGQQTVVQCQGSIHHHGSHFFTEDHYTVRWSDPSRHAA